ncbi:origin recognition complex subunit 2-like [Teleopsis dalmanni]|uniref:origin recognition complex subunit 2-like n=1 Tax=Teleopsis dalmanni TaxID=139649 RepID=UPI000D32991D|nr:origin recognition complex subunit 2-like [Teleopsis dalmanni]XP_037956272.1 origin recognition complex subunit 2-like [Teleopsis dalmanni]XP_037956273.1 origin recognition complex subunit 2-like [Teleopsis dalmanni]XP_037956274.1 origin recognition complex subunit 2-like [Teleopsis dalmanni]
MCDDEIKTLRPNRKSKTTNKRNHEGLIQESTNKKLMNSENSDSNDEEVIVIIESDDDNGNQTPVLRRSSRKPSPNKKYCKNFVVNDECKRNSRIHTKRIVADDEDELEDSNSETESNIFKPNQQDLQLLQKEYEVSGKNVFGFNTPKKRGGMSLVAINTAKTQKTPDTKRRKSTTELKTPSHVRNRVKSQIAKLVKVNSDSDFSADESEYEPSDCASSSGSDNADDSSDDAADDEPKTPHKGRRPIVIPSLTKTPSLARARQSARVKKTTEYVPESDGYFQSRSSSKIVTSDHTLDRLKNPRLPADRLFSLLASMKLSTEHETSINAIIEEYRSYFSKWMYILNEGFNLLIYGLGSKLQLLQSFHRDILAQQTVLVINGFFPSLTLKDILDSITCQILDAGISSSNPHEAVDMIEEEFSLIPETHLYIIVHNLDGIMLRNNKVQAILARLAKVENIHLIASIDHINTPLLWDQSKLSNYNFSWWDCTTMLPYTNETAFENSLLIQNSGELALASLRSVFSSLTTNSRGIYMLIVKHQLQNKNNPNHQGIAFKDLYWSCREAFLVSSDLALRAQLTEFLDHKLIKTKRSVDGAELLNIPIESTLLQQFSDEHEKK